MDSTILAYLLALFIGISLGFIGAGGSILTLPILVYIAHVDKVMATAYSLFIVGFTALVGSFTYMSKRLVHYKTALIFSIPSLTTVFLVRRYLMPMLPKVILGLDQGTFLLLFFSIFMLLASYNMIKAKKKEDNEADIDNMTFNYPLIFVEGIVVGVLTGLVGAGGGFLIIPALVSLAKLPMRLAIGTSLLIIAAKSLIGFMGESANFGTFDWLFLAIFTGMACSGIFIGTYFGKFVSSAKLKLIFGYFVLVMALYMISKELKWI